jgi:hypothetical protein
MRFLRNWYVKKAKQPAFFEWRCAGELICKSRLAIVIQSPETSVKRFSDAITKLKHISFAFGIAGATSFNARLNPARKFRRDMLLNAPNNFVQTNHVQLHDQIEELERNVLSRCAAVISVKAWKTDFPIKARRRIDNCCFQMLKQVLRVSRASSHATRKPWKKFRKARNPDSPIYATRGFRSHFCARTANGEDVMRRETLF